jgi:hypothetical protein
MKVLEVTEKMSMIQLSIQEFTIIKNVLQAVKNSLILSEFIARVDVSPEDISSFLNSVELQNQSKINMIMQISLDEAKMLIRRHCYWRVVSS